jgi:citrate synthase
MSDDFGNIVHSTIWRETPQSGNPYVADAAFCRGYDVYGDMLGKTGWAEYLFLMVAGERPAAQVLRAFELLAVALANPGPRDPSVHAAMAASVGGSPAAAALTAAIAVGAGSYGGAREVLLAMEAWTQHGRNLAAWTQAIANPPVATRELVWPQADHTPGFAPHAESCARPVLQTLERLNALLPDGCLAWLAEHRRSLERAASCPLGMTGVAAAALTDMGFAPDQGEMLVLLMRLPGAAAHALEQKQQGYRRFPFFSLQLDNDPKERT